MWTEQTPKNVNRVETKELCAKFLDNDDIRRASSIWTKKSEKEFGATYYHTRQGSCNLDSLDVDFFDQPMFMVI